MDRDTIYLDNDDEITSVVDKLKGSDFSSIDLVIPKEALVLKSVVNLKLLKKQADALNKEIVIVTQDKVGKKLATQVGIPVIDKPGQEPKEVRMSESEDPQKAAQAAATAAAASVAAEEAIEFKKNPKVASSIEKDEDGIEFKEAAAPMEPTNKVVTPAEESVPPLKDQAKGKKKRFGWKFWTAVSAVGLLALLVLGYIFVPLVNINITLAAQKKAVNFNFKADKAATAIDTGNQIIPAQEIVVDQSKSQQYPATGKKDAGTKASGTVTVHNHNYSTSPVQLVSGTRLVTTGGLVFVTTSNVSVPGYTKVGSSVTDGTVDAAVQASAPGDQYNVNASTMSVPGLGASTADIYGSSISAFSGGTTRQITFVTQTDVNSAKDDLAKQMQNDLVNAANQKAGPSTRLLDKAYKIEPGSASASPDVNGEGSNFTLTLKEKITALVFREEDLTKLATAVLGDQIGSTKEIVEQSSLTSQASLVSSDFDKGTIQASLSGEAFIASKLDTNNIKTQISGVPNDKAITYLKGLDGVENAEITAQFPGFLKRIPRVKSHIYLKTSLDKNGS